MIANGIDDDDDDEEEEEPTPDVGLLQNLNYGEIFIYFLFQLRFREEFHIKYDFTKTNPIKFRRSRKR